MCKYHSKEGLNLLISNCVILRNFIKVNNRAFRKRIQVVRKLIRFYNVEIRYEGILDGTVIADIYKRKLTKKFFNEYENNSM